MDTRKFVEYYYEEEEEYTFVKVGEDKWEFYFSDEAGSMRSFASTKKNGVEVANKYNDVVQLYHELNLSEVKAERTFSYTEHLDDDDEGEAAKDNFDAAVEAAREWLYA